MDNKPVVLSVDDNPSEVALISASLQHYYDVNGVGSSEECLTYLQTKRPDVLLLDVNLPETTGYELCELVKANPRWSDIPVLFLSGRSEIEDRIQGYNAGGEDYLVKPVDPMELLCKVRLLSQRHLSKASLDNQLKLATKTAYSAMSSFNEMGLLVNFMEGSYKCDSYSVLLGSVLSLMNQFSLSGAVQLRPKGQYFSDCTSPTPISPLEEQLLTQGSNARRIVSHGSRALFNAPKITLLVKNMPMDDEGLYGRLNDHLAIVLNACELKIKSLETQFELMLRKKSEVSIVLNEAIAHMAIFADSLGNFKSDTHLLFQDMIVDVEEGLSRAGLSSEQEQCILSTLEESRDRFYKLSQEEIQVDETLTLLKQDLNKAIDMV